jgi:ABC-type sugar transport system ATPase subunit
LKAVLSSYHNKEIILGIRPENLSLHQLPGRFNNTISAKVKVIEPLGNRTDVHLTNHKGRKLVAYINAYAKLKVNDVVKVYIDLEKIHVFESGETGKNITMQNYY